MMKTSFFAALFAASAIAGPAFAQDYNFSGVRGEARVGWDNVRANATAPDPDDDDETVSAGESDDGIGYGLEIGYDYQSYGGFVAGIYGGVDFSNAGRCAEVLGDDLGCFEPGRNLTAGVRAGFALGESVLVYAKGGYSNGRLRFDYDADVDDDDNDLFALRRNRHGWHIGGGFEVALSRNLYMKAEYTYTDYGRLTYTDPDDEDLTARIGASRHQATAGIGVRF
jgi:outer membrane immunogenic protein